MNPDRFARWEAAQNILCIRLDNLGDVLMTTPAVRALKVARPQRKITLLGSASGVNAARFIPDLDDAIRYDAPWSKHPMPPTPAEFLAMRNTLVAGRYDAAVVFTVYSQNPLPGAMMAYLAEIPLRLAYCRENPYHLLTDWVPETEPASGLRHEAQRQMDLVHSVGTPAADPHMRFEVPPEAREGIDACLEDEGVRAGEPVIVLHPGATAASRRYPPERYAEVAAQLIDRCDGRIFVTGSADERALTQRVCADSAATGRIHDLSGDLGLGELGALIARADLLISNNTGPVHIASAVGTPVVDLYALTNPQHTPWQVPHRVLSKDVPCKYCYKSVCPEGHNLCLRGVTVAEVVEAALGLLHSSPELRCVSQPPAARLPQQCAS
jgi:lipopolysaccharide heptosyltransferase II